MLGRLGDTELPRRLVLRGDVYEVEQSFGLPDASCEQPPGSGPSPGSGGTIGGGGAVISNGAVISYPSFPVEVRAVEQVQVREPFGRRTFVWHSPSGEATVISGRRSTGGSSAIEGALYTSLASGATLSTSGDVVLTGPLGLPTERIEAGGEIRINSLDAHISPDEDFEVVEVNAGTVGLPDFCTGSRRSCPRRSAAWVASRWSHQRRAR